MTDEKHDTISETSTDLGERVIGEIGSLHQELAEIRELLNRGHSVERAVEEYRYLPHDVENVFRWGFIGAWRKGRASCVHVTTTSEDDFFNDPDCSPENVAALATAFTNPNTIRVCTYLFHNGGSTREELQSKLNLSHEELDAAVVPLLEWRFVVWKDNRLDPRDSELNRQGVNYAITLMAMAKTAFAYKDRQVRK